MSHEIHTLFWKNSDPKFYNYHSQIMNKFGLKINYCNENINTGEWMNNVMNHATSDVVGFVDIDCVITNNDIVPDCINFSKSNKTIVGIAQVSNHIFPRNHIFAGPAFFFIYRDTWIKVGRPSFMQLKNKFKNFFRTKYDVCEGVCYKFEKKNISYKALYPTHFDIPRKEYRLHNYGAYGVGTLFQGGVYHLYESRRSENLDLFEKRCKQILSNNFETKNMFSSLENF